MSLSLGTRRRDQTQLAATQQQLSVATRSRFGQQHLAIQKQRSCIEAGKTTEFLTNNRRQNLQRGLSVGRTEGTRNQKPATLVQRRQFNGLDLQRQLSVDQVNAAVGRSKKGLLKSKYLGTISRLTGHVSSCAGLQTGSVVRAKSNEGRIIAWSSTSSLLKTLDEELTKSNNGSQQTNSNLKSAGVTSTTNNPRSSKQDHLPESLPTKADTTKFNLSIVLPQTIDATSENDIDSASEGTEILKKSTNKTYASAANRRANFQLAHDQNTAFNMIAAKPNNTVTATNSCNITATGNNFNVLPLTIQRRPPLARAMSAPVRTRDEKPNMAANKRKARRRKTITRDKSLEEEDNNGIKNEKDTLLEYDNKDVAGKKILARSRSTLVSDVITLVSLVSSEGSDSDKDDTDLASTMSTGSPCRRAPFLRKTGKSVSFQENDSSHFQFYTREFPNFIRRGSIAPLAARIRANRPPTAPPVSLFLSESNSDKKITGSDKDAACNVDDAVNEKSLPDEIEMPDYVKSIKERECWKLFHKMSAKGVNVTYDTIVRGMLTPTEFRQLQKQRDLEEAKTRKAEEVAVAIAAAAEMEKLPKTLKKSSKPIDLLVDGLIKK